MSLPPEPRSPLEYVHLPPVMPSGTPPTMPASPQLSPENLQQLQIARNGMKKIRRAIGVANFDGWTVAACGALTFVLGIGDITTMALGAALTAIGVVELNGVKRLKKLDVPAINILAWNQVALGGLLLIYAVWRIIYVAHHPGGSLGEAGADLDAATLKEVAQMEQSIALAVYYSLIAVAVLYQGGMALYYLSRRKYLQTYLKETPDWITQMQRAGVSV